MGKRRFAGAASVLRLAVTLIFASLIAGCEYLHRGLLMYSPKWLLLDPSDWPVSTDSARKNIDIDSVIEKFQSKASSRKIVSSDSNSSSPRGNGGHPEACKSKVQKVVARTDCSLLKILETTINVELLCSRNSTLWKVLDDDCFLLIIKEAI